MKKTTLQTKGFILLPVVMGIALVGVIVFLLNRSSGLTFRIVTDKKEADTLSYAAEAGLEHAQWTLRQHVGCTGYPSLAGIPFNNHSYSAVTSPSNGSPVTITATATNTGGSTRIATVGNIRKSSNLPCDLRLQPDGLGGKDTYIYKDKPDQNQGNSVDLMTDSESAGKGPARSLLQFDLSNIPTGSVVSSAKLSIYLHSNSGSTTDFVEGHRLTQDWLEGVGLKNDGANWLTYDGVNPWATTAGDYDPKIEDSYQANGTGWKTLDLTSLVQEWVDGTYPNYGVILLSPLAGGNNEKFYHSSDAAVECFRPKLYVSAQCECSSLISSCNSDFLASSNNGGFATPAGLSDPWGITFLPEGYTFNGTLLEGGGWLINDYSTQTLSLTDMCGNPLTALVGSVIAKGIAYVDFGTYAGQIALLAPAANRVYFMDSSGNLPDSFNTVSFSKDVVGISFIGITQTSTYNGHFAITSTIDQTNVFFPAVYIVSQNGSKMATIGTSAFAMEPWGVAHLPGTDKLLVVDKTGLATIVGFDGTVYGQYNTGPLGATQPQGATIHPYTCEHVINDHDTFQVHKLN